METEKVKELVTNAIDENPELFLLELKFLEDNKIYVEVDGDKGVSLNECIRISREVEHNLDREIEDFSIEVTSPDIAKPLQKTRQYVKNIDRVLQIKLKDNSHLEGILKKVLENKIELEITSREPKPVGKGKITVVKLQSVQFIDIEEAKVKIIF